MEFSKYILFPFTLLYDLATKVRNKAYDLNLRKSVHFETNVISVGNLEVGGTGKTPMIEYLINLLKSNWNVATLSRGYMRKSKGFRSAGHEDTAQSIGDEPFQLYSKFKEDITVNVGETRETAIPFILAEHPETDIILLDDAFQYRTISPSVSILLTRFSRLFYNDYILPAGRLRETGKSAKRADIVVVSKCPEDIDEESMSEIKNSLSKYSDAAVFFSCTAYKTPQHISGPKVTNLKDVVLVSGIAHNDSIGKYVSENYDLKKHFSFPDHHKYSNRDKDEILEYSHRSDSVILLSEKDAVKWSDGTNQSTSIYSLPIMSTFVKDGTHFDDLILSSIKEYELPY